MTRKLLALIALLPLSQLAVAQQANEPVTTVFLIRHAERADEPRQDPPLTEKGVARSEALARLLSTAGVKAIYTSHFARTKLTAEPQPACPCSSVLVRGFVSGPKTRGFARVEVCGGLR